MSVAPLIKQRLENEVSCSNRKQLIKTKLDSQSKHYKMKCITAISLQKLENSTG